MTSTLCDACGKVLYTSKAAARASLTGQLRSKRIRLYTCAAHPGRFHVTKEGVTRIDGEKQHRDRRRYRY